MLSPSIPALVLLLALVAQSWALPLERKQPGPARITKDAVRFDASLTLSPADEQSAPPSSHRRSSLDDIVFAENFEGSIDGSIPPGWSRADLDNGFCSQWNRNSVWQSYHYGRHNAHSGDHVAMVHYNDGASSNDDWLIMPPIVGGAPLLLEYWGASQDPAYLESWEVRVSTTGTSPGDFTNLVETVTDAPVTWSLHLLDLSAFAAAPFYVAFHYNSTDRFVMKLDDIEVSAGSLGIAGGISGQTRRRLTDSTSATLVEVNVELLELGWRTISDAAGNYAFNFLNPGSYSLRFLEPQYAPLVLTGVQVVSGEITDSVRAVMTQIDTVVRNYRYDLAFVDISDFDTATASFNVNQTFEIRDVDVTVWIDHSWVGDLDVWIRAPNAPAIQLVQHNIVVAGDSIWETRFDDEAGIFFHQGEAPYTGSFLPLNPLSALDSTLTNGTWSLVVYDNYEDDGGQIRDYTVHMSGIDPPGVLETDPEHATPGDFRFDGNFPNPFNAGTEFSFTLDKAAPVTLTLYNLQGQAVRTLVDGTLSAGPHLVHYGSESLASGVYIARLQTPEHSAAHKIVLLK